MSALEVLQQLVVGSGLFQRVQLSPVEVLQQRVEQQPLVFGGAHDRRDLLKPGFSAGSPASLTHDELVAPRRRLTDHDRLEQAHLLDGGDQFGEGVLVEDFARLPRVRPDGIQRHFGEVRAGHLNRKIACALCTRRRLCFT
ncbi:hypothetical protein K530_47520 [Streptomyces noursei CCRC 11814]|nr:hypothetical protein K530_47520 [Streptomyces noursei CCRC 11814]